MISIAQHHHQQAGNNRNSEPNLDVDFSSSWPDDVERGVVKQMEDADESSEAVSVVEVDDSEHPAQTSQHPEVAQSSENNTHAMATPTQHQLSSGLTVTNIQPAPGTNATTATSQPQASSALRGEQPRTRHRHGRSHALQREATFADNAPGLPHSHLPGSVQGIDLKRSPQEWEWLSQQLQAPVNAFVLDFAPDKVAMRSNVSNAGLADLLKRHRPGWAQCRWINIDGVSWDVIQALALRFDIHPLAVEDVVQSPQRIKADLYEGLLYVSCHLITLAHDGSEDNNGSSSSSHSLPSPSSQQDIVDAVSSMPKSKHQSTQHAQTNHAAPGKQHDRSYPVETAAAAAAAEVAAAAIRACHMASSPFQQPGTAGWWSHMRQETGGNLDSSCKEGGDASNFSDSDDGAASGFELPSPRHATTRLPGARIGRGTSVSKSFAFPKVHRAECASAGTMSSSHSVVVGAHTAVGMQPAASSRGPSSINAADLTTPAHQQQARGNGNHGRQQAAGVVAGSAHILSMPPRQPQHARQVAQTSHIAAGITAAMSPGKKLTTHKTGLGVPVHKQQVSIFITDDSTIISIFETSGTALTRPLLQQLREPRTLARDSTDASYLLCLLLDALADSAYPVVDAYSDIISEYQTKILDSQPQAGITKELHLIQGDIATLRRTVLPTLRLVTGLRAHATAGAAAATAVGRGANYWYGGAKHARKLRKKKKKAAAADVAVGDNQNNKNSAGNSNTAAATGKPQHPLVSSLTKTYLGDVQDHLTSLLDALDSQTEACRDLIDLAFNLIAHGTNQAMQALTVVSVLFLPLTFLAGIYGMNFDFMPELHWHYGYVYFYGVSLFIVSTFLAIMWKKGMYVWGGAAAAAAK